MAHKTEEKIYDAISKDLSHRSITIVNQADRVFYVTVDGTSTDVTQVDMTDMTANESSSEQSQQSSKTGGGNIGVNIADKGGIDVGGNAGTATGSTAKSASKSSENASVSATISKVYPKTGWSLLHPGQEKRFDVAGSTPFITIWYYDEQQQCQMISENATLSGSIFAIKAYPNDEPPYSLDPYSQSKTHYTDKDGFIKTHTKYTYTIKCRGVDATFEIEEKGGHRSLQSSEENASMNAIWIFEETDFQGIYKIRLYEQGIQENEIKRLAVISRTSVPIFTPIPHYEIEKRTAAMNSSLIEKISQFLAEWTYPIVKYRSQSDIDKNGANLCLFFKPIFLDDGKFRMKAFGPEPYVNNGWVCFGTNNLCTSYVESAAAEFEIQEVEKDY